MDGQSLARVPPQERNVAMVFQDPALYPHMTVAENISFGLRLRRCSPSEIGRRVGWAAEMLELSECLARKPMELSGGQTAQSGGRPRLGPASPGVLVR